MLEILQRLSQSLLQHPAKPDAQQLVDVANGLRNLPLNGASSDSEVARTLEKFMRASATVEPVWGLLAGTRLWAVGQRQAHDFHNVWNCARYAGIESRFSGFTATQHLQWVANLDRAAEAEHVDPAPFIVRGNALRQLHRHAEAESAYIEGLEACPEDPFLKFRLVDLWLMTYQHARAEQLLASLRTRYPSALEMMFCLPVVENAVGPENVLPELSADGAELVWLVAADPVYLQRYGLRLAEGIAQRAGNDHAGKVKLHVHGVTEPGKPLPVDVLGAMAGLLPLHVTQRELNLVGASPNQRKALFASERFLFLAEMLAKYQRPMLVTDIDVDPLKSPLDLIEQMGDADIAHTRFGTVREAWDRYPATALLFRPTAAAVAFCKRLSGMIITLLNSHPNPWFVDQIALFRLIEGGLTPAKLACLELLLTDTDSPRAYFRILHGSWEA